MPKIQKTFRMATLMLLAIAPMLFPPAAVGGTNWEDTNLKDVMQWKSTFDGKSVTVDVLNKTDKTVKAVVRICYIQAGCINKVRTDWIPPNQPTTILKGYPSTEEVNGLWVDITEQK